LSQVKGCDMADDAPPQTFTFVFGKAGSRQTTAIVFPDDESAGTFARTKLEELHRGGQWTHVSISRGDRLYADFLGTWTYDLGSFNWTPGG
jgi:hypothetical protein